MVVRQYCGCFRYGDAERVGFVALSAELSYYLCTRWLGRLRRRSGVRLLSRDVTGSIRKAAKATNLTKQGYNINCIGSHSLRASGAMALKLNGFKSTGIMKVGHWRSLTFLTYIHSQIAALNACMSQRISRSISFYNVVSQVHTDGGWYLVIRRFPGVPAALFSDYTVPQHHSTQYKVERGKHGSYHSAQDVPGCSTTGVSGPLSPFRFWQFIYYGCETSANILTIP
jgi:hypothetical protein